MSDNRGAVIKKYECVVEEIPATDSYDKIMVRLTDLADPCSQELAWISSKDIPLDERKHIALGAVFHLTIYDTLDHSPESYHIEFQQERWTKHELEQAKIAAYRAREELFEDRCSQHFFRNDDEGYLFAAKLRQLKEAEI